MTIPSADDANALAAHIMAGRRHPLVVLSTDPATGRLALDADELRDAVGDLAEIVTVRTGALTWRLDELLPTRAQVYGGAGRSYPVDFGDDPDWRRSPLRFPGDHAIQHLIDDVLAQAHAAGLFTDLPDETVVPAVATVTGVIGSRALVDVDGHRQATISGETLFPSVPLEWMLAAGQRIAGRLDTVSGRFMADPVHSDVTDLAQRYPHGAVTLALVAEADQDHARLLLHPDVGVTVHIADLSTNPHDTIAHLLAEGDVVAVRVVHLSTGGLHLRMSDVDDDEPVLAPVTLVADGPPWLEEDRPLPHARRRRTAVSVVDASAPPTTDGEAVGAEAEAEAVCPAAEGESGAGADAGTGVGAETGTRPIPGPGMRTVTQTPVVAEGSAEASPSRAEATPASALRSTQLELQAARTRNARLEQLLRDAQTDDQGVERLRAEVHALQLRLREERAERGTLEHELRRMRDRHAELTRATRQARRRSTVRHDEGVAARRGRWLDANDWVRHEILLTWVDRIDANERDRWPLPAYAIGPAFADSLCGLDETVLGKAMRACVDVLTGRVRDLPARAAHVLRQGDGGDDPDTVRASDGAKCWRVYVEHKTPQARRLHYWVLPDGSIELSRVVAHDDTEP